ncbi:MAG: Coq4 family protein [Caulobacteraceae bacterium]
MSALRAYRKLQANSEDTLQVFEIMRALNGRAELKGYLRLLQSRRGSRFAFEAQELADKLCDADRLSAYPPGTVGAIYRDFMAAEQLSAAGLVALSEQATNAEAAEPHPVQWYGRRIRDSHDVWHVLTGYGRDPLGELCLVAFSFAQTREPGWALIAIAGGLNRLRSARGGQSIRAIWQAYRDGCKASWLAVEDVLGLLEEPLDQARRRLNIPAPDAYTRIPLHFRVAVSRG